MTSQVINKERKSTHSSSDTSLHRKMLDVMNAVYDAGENGMTTREVANICDLSVYAARNWLIKLENEGYVIKKMKPRNTTWHQI